MKSFLTACYLSLFISVCTWEQTHQHSREFSFVVLNGISSQSEKEDYKIAYVNSIRFQISFEKSQKYNSIIGLQYGKNGSSINWVCGDNWDYCQTLDVFSAFSPTTASP